MCNINRRYLIKIIMNSSSDSNATTKINNLYFRLNDIIVRDDPWLCISDICDECNKNDQVLGALIRNRCLDLTRSAQIYIPNVNKATSNIPEAERKNIRILLYPGARDNIEGLNLRETTHNMIIEFDNVETYFVASEKHRTPPSFYQRCISEEIALLYIESLLVDSSMCHYLGISDVAQHHDEKQHISKEKVQFLKEIVANKDLTFLNVCARELVTYVASKIDENTPYISFLSIFTIAHMDVYNKGLPKAITYFEEYCKLWSRFQKWYFNKHGRLFDKEHPINNPRDTVLHRNTYKGQVSPSEFQNRIIELINNPAQKSETVLFGSEYRYALIIITHNPEDEKTYEQINVLFPNKIHPAKWDVVYWDELKKYKNIISYLEIVPIIIYV